MDVKLINPFIKATLNVLGTMAQVKAEPGKPIIKEDSKTWGIVTGIIGMAGTEVTGNLIISFEKTVIIEIVSKMLMEEFTDITQDVIDAVGEITNMITGGTKRELAEMGLSISMATPIVIVGKDTSLSQLSTAPVLQIPFQTSAGSFVVEANLAPVKK